MVNSAAAVNHQKTSCVSDFRGDHQKNHVAEFSWSCRIANIFSIIILSSYVLGEWIHQNAFKYYRPINNNVLLIFLTLHYFCPFFLSLPSSLSPFIILIQTTQTWTLIPFIAISTMQKSVYILLTHIYLKLQVKIYVRGLTTLK